MTSGDQLNAVLPVGSLMPQYFDIRDFLGSTPTNSLTVALNENGTQSWYATQGMGESKFYLVQTNSAGDSLVVNIANGNQNLTGTVPIRARRVFNRSVVKRHNGCFASSARQPKQV